MTTEIIHGRNSEIEEVPLPFRSVTLPPEVFRNKDADEIMQGIFGDLVLEGSDVDAMVFRGFDARELLRTGTFGANNSAYAASKKSVELSGNGDVFGDYHNPVKYLQGEIALVPAIVALGIEDLKGAHVKGTKYAVEVTKEELAQDPELVWWTTKNGESLDQAVNTLYIFEK